MKTVLMTIATVLLLPAAAASVAADSLPVDAVVVHREQFTKDFHLTGTIEAAESYSAGFRDGGRVIAVNVDVGDIVHAGEVIAEIDPTQADASLRAAQASLDAAEAALVQARQARDRAQGLLEKGSGTQAELDAAMQSFLTAKASRDQAKAQLNSAKREADDTQLRAVEDAVVTERAAEPGQVVGAGQEIVTLANLGARDAVFLLPDDARLDELMGQDVRITPVEGGAGLTAPVTEISPVVEDNGTVTAKVRLTGAAAATFTLGEAVVGELSLPEEKVIMVPWSALAATAQGPAVWIVDPATSRVHLRQIVIASYTTQNIAVKSGLKAGETVVSDGSHGLFPDRQVDVKELSK